MIRSSVFTCMTIRTIIIPTISITAILVALDPWVVLATWAALVVVVWVVSAAVTWVALAVAILVAAALVVISNREGRTRIA